MPKYYLPAVITCTDEETSEISRLETDTKTYQDEMNLKSLSGTTNSGIVIKRIKE